MKDHVGYVNALSELKANRLLQKKLMAAASPKRKQAIKERLDHKESVMRELYTEATDGTE